MQKTINDQKFVKISGHPNNLAGFYMDADTLKEHRKRMIENAKLGPERPAISASQLRQQKKEMV